MSKKDFTDNRAGTGTREWSERSCNIGMGCANNCRYCYARYRLEVWLNKVNPGTWDQENVDDRALARKERPCRGIVMFPTQHDITEGYLEAAKKKIRQHLQIGNKLLIVTKPRTGPFMELLTFLEAQDKLTRGQTPLNVRKNILFRFSITSMNDETSRYWEPGASLPAERIMCLQLAAGRGFQTSVSVEPVLPGPFSYFEAGEMIYAATEPSITDTIWYGTLNKAAQRIREATPDVLDTVAAFQAPAEVLRLVQHFSPEALYTKVRWKDSVKEIIKADRCKRELQTGLEF